MDYYDYLWVVHFDPAWTVWVGYPVRHLVDFVCKFTVFVSEWELILCWKVTGHTEISNSRMRVQYRRNMSFDPNNEKSAVE